MPIDASSWCKQRRRERQIYLQVSAFIRRLIWLLRRFKEFRSPFTVGQLPKIDRLADENQSGFRLERSSREEFQGLHHSEVTKTMIFRIGEAVAFKPPTLSSCPRQSKYS
jgi:hypothetical protein